MAIVFGLGLGNVVITAGVSQAVTCSGQSCTGHDPVVYGCTVSSTRSTTAVKSGFVLATLWNRYSTNCNANWGRAQLSDLALKNEDQLFVLVWTGNSDPALASAGSCYPGPSNTGASFENCAGMPFLGELGDAGTGYGGSGPAWTDMVNGTNKSYAEVFVVTSDGTILTSALQTQ